MKTIFLHGFIRFWPNSCCKLFIYVLCKRKIYVGHQVPHGTLFLARNDNWLLLTGDWNALISYMLFYARARSLNFNDIKRCRSTSLEMFWRNSRPFIYRTNLNSKRYMLEIGEISILKFLIFDQSDGFFSFFCDFRWLRAPPNNNYLNQQRIERLQHMSEFT